LNVRLFALLRIPPKGGPWLEGDGFRAKDHACARAGAPRRTAMRTPMRQSGAGCPNVRALTPEPSDRRDVCRRFANPRAGITSAFG